MQNKSALIIDDEPDIRELLDITLGRMGIRCFCVEDIGSAKDLLEVEAFDICLTDMRLPDGDGVDFVSYIQQYYPYLPVAVITAHGNMETAINALKSGAFDFISKPVDLVVLRKLVDSALNLSSEDIIWENRLIGESNIIQEVRFKISKLARSQAPIYISGESGVGKELVARLIHEQGPRCEYPFVAVNCGAIPQELMESEFFGHIKGSFTGANYDKEGLFEAASGGTLFLDEIAELPQHMQVKLLRAIQEKAIKPIGATREIPVDVRILSATHKDLSLLTEKGLFRQDLFYRINVIELNIPPLRERPEDIEPLIRYILSRFIADPGDTTPQISESALEALAGYEFPGNVRELENILERALTLCNGKTIHEGDLQLPTNRNVINGSKGKENVELDSYLDEVEKNTILEALEENRWNRTATAKKLGLSLRALRYRLKKLGLD